MSIRRTRSGLYRAARLLGDISAVMNGTVGRRVVRRTAGRTVGKQMRRMFR